MTRPTGRKFSVVKIAIPMWAVNVAVVAFLAFTDHEVPGSLGLSLAALSAIFPEYILGNVAQKKIEQRRLNNDGYSEDRNRQELEAGRTPGCP